MKKYIFIFFISFLYSAAFAQIEIDRLDNFIFNKKDKADYKGYINLAGNYHVNSNAFTNDFMKHLVFGGFIDTPQKDEVSKRLKTNNRFGLDLNIGLTGGYKIKDGLDFIGGINHREFFTGSFSRDAFEIAFRGNKPYAGKTATISPLKISDFNYESVFLGLQKDLSEKIMIGGGISLIRGDRFNSFNSDRASLFTEQSGQYVDIDMKFKMAYSPKSSSTIPQSNGAGAAVNLMFSYETEKGKLRFEMRDLGFINWSNLSYLQADTSFHYTGKSVNNIFSFNESTFSNMSRDSIASFFHIKTQKKSVNMMLPTTFNVNYLYNFTEKLNVAVGAKIMLNAAYIPRIYIKPMYSFKKNFIIAPNFAYGGFGRADFELGLAKNFNNKLLVSLNAFYFEYFVLPKKSAGQGLNLSISKVF